MSDETEFLREYVRSGSEEAFAELVRRCLPMVYSAALRQVNGDESAAKDIAQTVFIALARKARSLAGRELLAGWLYTSTRFTAASYLRATQRRQLREQIAVTMQETTVAPDMENREHDLKGVLDEAMSELAADDRNALLLRFFQDKALREVGQALGISEGAARMRVGRALEKLHTLLCARGVALSAATLGTVLAAQAVSAMPAGLAATITAAATAGGAGAVASLPPLLKLITMTKLKVGIIGTVLAASVVVPWGVHQQGLKRLRQENEALRLQADQAAQLAADNQRLSNQLAQANESQQLSQEQLRDLLRLRNEVGSLRRQTNELQAQRQSARPANAATSATTEDTSAAWVSKESWAFAGYATPEATFQTVWWAIAKGETNSLLTALHPDVRQQFEAHPEILHQMMTRRDYAEIPGFRILSKMGAPGEAVLTVDMFSRPDDPNPVGTNHAIKIVALKQVDNTWRFCGAKDLR